MKCYFTYDAIAGKVLIPGCWGPIHSNDIDDCHCTKHPKTFKAFERQEYKKILSEQSKLIAELEKEIIRLNKQIDNG